jgi:molybdopterin/thiamine biosynthesis adenylyltransferase
MDFSEQEIRSALQSYFQISEDSANLTVSCAPDNSFVRVEAVAKTRKWEIQAQTKHLAVDKVPQIKLIAPILQLAHVSNDCVICIDDGQGLSINYESPSKVIAFALFKAIEVLDKADEDRNTGHRELLKEFEGYWQGMAAYDAHADIDENNTTRFIYARVIQEKGKRPKCAYIFDNHHSENNIPEQATSIPIRKILFVRLKSPLLPPLPKAEVDWNFFEQIQASLDEIDLAKFKTLLHLQPSDFSGHCHLVISQERPDGGRSLFGMTLPIKSGRPNLNANIQAFWIKRIDSKYLRLRGGAGTVSESIHVAICGCGSVGSEIADTLASCGIHTITLVDNEKFEADNIFRHALGKSYIGKSKAKGLQEALKCKYPGLTINAIEDDAKKWISEIKHSTISIIVIAVGNPSLERYLAQQIRMSHVAECIVITWLEPLGLGGHAISISTTGEGCLDCVYRDSEKQSSLYPIVSFIEQGQSVSKNLTGCLGSFIEYSALHSKKTAIIAVELVYRQIAGNLSPHYTYWVGDDSLARMHNITPSYWHSIAEKRNPSEISKEIYEPSCTSCRNRSRD